MTVVFARPRYSYDSYSDIVKLIELSGYPLCYVDEIDAYNPNRCYICTPLNGEWNQGWPDAKARIIHWDLEWRLEGAYPVIPGVNEIWASDRWYAEKIGARYVLLGSHPGLALSPYTRHETIYNEWDLAPLAYIYGRRDAKIAEMRSAGLRIAPNGWGMDRDYIINRSTAMLHIHQLNNVPTIAPGRFALAAAYKMPLLAENVATPEGFDKRVIWGSYDELTQLALNTKDSTLDQLNIYGFALYNYLCVDSTFERCVEAAL